MDAQIINAFLLSSTRLFRTMFNIDCQHASPYLMEQERGHRWELSALLGLNGDVKGLAALRMHRIFLDQLLVRSSITFENEHERSLLADSLVKELLNIIAGNACGEIHDRSIDITTPKIVMGVNHQIAWPRKAPLICTPFRSTAGEFEVLVCIADS